MHPQNSKNTVVLYRALWSFYNSVCHKALTARWCTSSTVYSSQKYNKKPAADVSFCKVGHMKEFITYLDISHRKRNKSQYRCICMLHCRASNKGVKTTFIWRVSHSSCVNIRSCIVIYIKWYDIQEQGSRIFYWVLSSDDYNYRNCYLT